MKAHPSLLTPAQPSRQEAPQGLEQGDEGMQTAAKPQHPAPCVPPRVTRQGWLPVRDAAAAGEFPQLSPWAGASAAAWLWFEGCNRVVQSWEKLFAPSAPAIPTQLLSTPISQGEAAGSSSSLTKSRVQATKQRRSTTSDLVVAQVLPHPHAKLVLNGIQGVKCP